MTQASNRIAVIGVAGRFPGARDVDALWSNLCAGLESIRTLDDAELARAGVPAEVLRDPRFVRRSSDLADVELFDAGFFGFAPREAAVTDPQQRLLLELAWEAFEDAGHVPEGFAGARAAPLTAGVFVGASRNDYAERVLADPAHLAALGPFALEVATGRDFLATRIAYVLGLRGPAMTVQTACSTSLVCVHQACQSLLAGECDLALAGGASIRLPQGTGYVSAQGGVASPDGRCRAFDARAQGTVGGNGGALVLLRPLAAALADGDRVHAVILATAVNNDGRGKVGFTAPSVTGQAAVIEEALDLAGVSPDEIGYVEAHGTGTPLGDPIEVAALAEAFRRRAAAQRPGPLAPGPCALGSIKSNLGHLDAAAGIAGFVKTLLAVREGVVPPSLHFERANPELGLERTPFTVAAALAPWRAQPGPRRAGVSSFGIGGTNAHAVLEEPPASDDPAPAGRPARADAAPALAVLSARSPAALEHAAARLAQHLADHPGLDAGDVAWTLQAGRAPFAERAFAVGRTTAELAAGLGAAGRSRGRAATPPPAVAFLFPGQGSQHVGMAAGAAAAEPVVRRELERAAELARPLGLDLSRALSGGTALDETRCAQPALFAVEHALARCWMALGIEPAAMLGHSVGELVAACLAGVLSFEDGLRLVAERGRLMQSMPRGSMLAVGLAEPALVERLPRDVALGSVNGPELCIASGPTGSIEALESQLAREGIACRRVATSHAFHSPMMDGALAPFLEAVRTVELRPPERAFLSNVTGTWITDDEATDPRYWVEHLRRTVRLSEGLAELARRGAVVCLEVGPGRTLVPHARARGLTLLPSLARGADGDDASVLRTSLGRLWLAGVDVDWSALHARPSRVRLPTYPFERRRHWADAPAAARPVLEPAASPEPPPAPATAPATAWRASPGTSTHAASLHEVVAGVWRACLGLEQVLPDDDFLELGGSSLLALQVRARLAEELAFEVPLADVLEATRLSELVPRLERARRGAPARRSPLVHLGTRGTPLYCVHGIDGEVAAFAHLARALEPDRALVALRAPGLEVGETPQNDVAALARGYVEAVRAHADGPYHLAGHSFGALVALEMAHLLRAQGRTVAALALLDARLPAADSPPPDGDERALRAEAGAHLRRLGLPDDAPDFERRRAVLVAHARAASRHRPRALDGDALLVLARDERASDPDAARLRWHALVRGELRIESVPGDHLSMLKPPGVASVARALASRTDPARLGTPTVREP